MSTKRRPIVKAAFGLVAATAVLVPIVVLLTMKGPDGMGAGAAVGGAITVIAFAFAILRSARRPANSTTLERSATGTGDERDRLVGMKAAAVLGVTSLPIAGITASAVAIGAPALPTLTIMLYTMLATLAVSFLIISRRT